MISHGLIGLWCVGYYVNKAKFANQLAPLQLALCVSHRPLETIPYQEIPS